MAYPPTVPPATRVNSTPQADNHPDDHNAISAALSDIINELGANPGGTFATVQARLDAVATSLAGKASLAGNTFTGTQRFGGNTNADQAGCDINCATGAINNTISSAAGSGATSANLTLNRWGTTPGPADVGGVFVNFRRGQDLTVGQIGIGPSSSQTAYLTTSDERLKDELGPVDDPLGRLAALRPIHFAWKSDGYEQDGFLAHEVQPVVPEAVSGTRDAVDTDGNIIPMQLDTSKLVPLLVAAVQALAAQVAALTP